MNMNRELRVLEFDKIREQLAALCVTPLGAALCVRLHPESDFDQVRRALSETQEAVSLIEHTGGNPLHSFEKHRRGTAACQKGRDAFLPDCF